MFHFSPQKRREIKGNTHVVDNECNPPQYFALGIGSNTVHYVA